MSLFVEAWPIPHWWPMGTCACPDCQLAAHVVHHCGGTELWETCGCLPSWRRYLWHRLRRRRDLPR